MKLFIVGYKEGKKVSEEDITDYSIAEVQQAIEIQDMQGRTWRYETEEKGKPNDNLRQ